MIDLISSIWWVVAATFIFWRVVADGHTHFTIWTAIPIFICLVIYGEIIKSLWDAIHELFHAYEKNRSHKRIAEKLRREKTPEQLAEMLQQAEAIAEKLSKQYEQRQ